MKFAIPYIIPVGVAINLVCLAVVASHSVGFRINSKNQLSARQLGLRTVAQHYKSDSCWTIDSDQPFKLGDLVNVPGSLIGKIPTGCVKSPNTQQFLHVAYLDGQLIVRNVFTPTELRNQLSTKDEE